MLPSIRGLGPGPDATMRLFVRIGMSGKAAPKSLNPSGVDCFSERVEGCTRLSGRRRGAVHQSPWLLAFVP